MKILDFMSRSLRYIEVILIILIAILMLNGIQNYIQSSFTPTMGIINQKEASSPSPTVCGLGNYRYNLDALKKYGYKAEKYYNRYNRIQSWHGNDSSVTDPLYGQKIFDDITYPITTYVKSLEVHLYGQSRTFINITKDNLKNYFGEIRRTLPGKCYMFYPDEDMKEVGIKQLKIILNMEARVYISRPNHFFDLSRIKVLASVGNVAEYTVNYKKISIAQRKTEGNKFNCMHMKEDLDTCLERVLFKASMDRFGCTAPWIQNNSKSNFAEVIFTSKGRLNNEQDDCPRSCEMYLFGISNADVTPLPQEKRHESHILLKFPYKVVFVKEEMVYTLLSLFAELGGYAGLLLGSSALGIVTKAKEKMKAK